MAVRLRPDGTWEFDGLDEAVEFERRRKTTTRSNPPTSPEKPPAKGGEPVAPTPWSDQARAGKGLRLLAAAGSRGMASNDLASQLGLSTPKAISGVAQGMRRRIAAVANGTPVSKILWNEGEPGNLRWFADTQKLKELGLLA